jgi:hypothetical protein
LEQQAAAVPSSERSYPSNEQERAWISAHRDEYLGQWVALDGDRLVAHGTDAKRFTMKPESKASRHPILSESRRNKRPAWGMAVTLQLTFASVYDYGTEAIILPIELKLAD